jgi:hypothetical protein
LTPSRLPDEVAAPDLEELERAVLARVVERGREWFPESSGSAPPRLHLLSSRPRARLYAVALGDDPGRPRVLAKVRRDGPVPTSTEAGRERPSLSSRPLASAELAGLEFAGLCATAHMVEGDLRFAAVRPLDHLPEHATILMDFVEAPTLRSLLVRDSRLSPPSRSVRSTENEPTWERVGAWLALFQRSLPVDGLPARQHTRSQVIGMFEAYDRFLSDRLGRGSVRDVAARGAELATVSLPDSLPLALGHGDYAPRNVFRRPDRRLTVFDPLARWAVPTYEDLCRFMVNVRLMGLQMHTHGAAFSAAWVESLERDVLRGYRAEGGDAPDAALRCYELLILLDKWSALVDVSGGLLGRLHRGSLSMASGYLRGQAGRLLELAGA